VAEKDKFGPMHEQIEFTPEHIFSVWGQEQFVCAKSSFVSYDHSYKPRQYMFRWQLIRFKPQCWLVRDELIPSYKQLESYPQDLDYYTTSNSPFTAPNSPSVWLGSVPAPSFNGHQKCLPLWDDNHSFLEILRTDMATSKDVSCKDASSEDASSEDASFEVSIRASAPDDDIKALCHAFVRTAKRLSITAFFQQKPTRPQPHSQDQILKITPPAAILQAAGRALHAYPSGRLGTAVLWQATFQDGHHMKKLHLSLVLEKLHIMLDNHSLLETVVRSEQHANEEVAGFIATLRPGDMYQIAFSTIQAKQWEDTNVMPEQKMHYLFMTLVTAIDKEGISIVCESKLHIKLLKSQPLDKKLVDKDGILQESYRPHHHALFGQPVAEGMHPVECDHILAAEESVVSSSFVLESVLANSKAVLHSLGPASVSQFCLAHWASKLFGTH